MLSKLLKNPFTDSIRSETVDSLTKKNIALTKELSKMKLEMENLKNIISAFSIVKKELPNLKLKKAPKDNTLIKQILNKTINPYKRIYFF